MKRGTLLLLPLVLLGRQAEPPDVGTTYVPFSDAKPIVGALREDLQPAELRARTLAELEAIWPDWVARRGAAASAVWLP